MAALEAFGFMSLPAQGGSRRLRLDKRKTTGPEEKNPRQNVGKGADYGALPEDPQAARQSL